MTKDEKRIEWKSRVESWKQSGLSVSKWCKEHDLKDYQMHYWIKKFDPEMKRGKRQSSNTQWLAVQVADETESVARGNILIHVGEISVEVQPGVDSKLLTDVIRALQLNVQ
ncbi:IS66 family insertion sequence element accessory protein TnpB [Bacillaceae bacterium S4-13-58]